MRILVTGSRDWPDRAAVHMTLDGLRKVASARNESLVVVHGDCPTGADAMAAQWAKQCGIEVEAYPAEWDRYGKAAGPMRNQKMVDLGADLCIGFPIAGSRGTLHCMTRAYSAGIAVLDMNPNLSVGNPHE